MRVLLLSPCPERLEPTLLRAGDTVQVSTEPLVDAPEVDYIVSYGYRHILCEPVLSKFEGRTVNAHISLLPWNRGADPNFWSWFDDTPKGISFHRIDAGIDTGRLLQQKEVHWMDDSRTLRSTYADLHKEVVKLFGSLWPMLRLGVVPSYPQTGVGTYHRTPNKAQWWNQLPLGHDTPVCAIRELGRTVAAEAAAGRQFFSKAKGELLGSSL